MQAWQSNKNIFCNKRKEHQQQVPSRQRGSRWKCWTYTCYEVTGLPSCPNPGCKDLEEWRVWAWGSTERLSESNSKGKVIPSPRKCKTRHFHNVCSVNASNELSQDYSDIHHPSQGWRLCKILASNPHCCLLLSEWECSTLTKARVCFSVSWSWCARFVLNKLPNQEYHLTYSSRGYEYVAGRQGWSGTHSE